MKTLVDFVPAFRALLVALAGVELAHLWFTGRWYVGLGIAVAVALAGAMAGWLGDHLLPDHPVGAVVVLEWWLLVPMALAAVASAAVIIVGVRLAVPDTVKDPAVKETAGALLAGVTTFLTAAFVSAVGDRDKSGISERIRDRLRSHYARNPAGAKRVKQIEAEGPIELLLHSDLQLAGWDRETRLARARGIAKELAAARVPAPASAAEV